MVLSAQGGTKLTRQRAKQLPKKSASTYAPNAKYNLTASSHALPEVVINGKKKPLMRRIGDALNPSVMVQAAPGTATGYSTSGAYMPRVKSNVGTELATATTAVASPWLVAPGSSFWMNPLTQQMMAGTAMSEGVNLGTKVLTGRDSFGQLVGDAVEDVSGWNPNNEWWGQIATESLNPGWYRNPSSVMNTIGRAGNTVENIINNKGFALTSPSGKIVTWVGKGLGSKISLEDVGNGWLRPSYIQSKTPGTGRKLYDAAINTAKRNGYKGIESGFDLLSAPKTYRTWEHYPSRIYLGNYGKHSNQNVIRATYIGNDVNTPEALLNATKNNIEATFNNAPVYGLTTPSEEVTTVNLPKVLLKKDYEEIPIGLHSREPLVARGTSYITAENAASITPEQWTAAQDAAIKAGNTAEAQRLRDLHFQVSAPNTTTVNELGNPVHNYHGTTSTFTAFDPQKIGSTTGDKSGFFFTDNKSAADFYSHETGSAWNNLKLMLGLYKGHKPQVYNVYLNTTKPMITDFHGGVDKVGREILAKEAIKNGNDANVLQNIIDGPPTLPHNVTIMRNPKHIKLADAVTYDDKGVRIPLGERDNFKLNDIRYSWLPWFLGGSTAATLYNKSK